jgi:hypothetical protein
VKYLCAVTGLGVIYPGYINFSEDEATGDVWIRGRQQPTRESDEGASFELRLPKVCIELMFAEGLRNLKHTSG